MTEDNRSSKQPSAGKADPHADKNDASQAHAEPGESGYSHADSQKIGGEPAADGDTLGPDDIETLIGELIAQFDDVEKSVPGDGPQRSQLSPATTPMPGDGSSTATGSDDEISPDRQEPLSENELASIARRLAPPSPGAGPGPSPTLRAQSFSKRVPRLPTIGIGTAIGLVAAVIALAGILYPMVAMQTNSDATVADVASDERTSLRSASSAGQESGGDAIPQTKSEDRIVQLDDDAPSPGRGGSGSNSAVEHRDNRGEPNETTVIGSGVSRIQRTERTVPASTVEGDGAASDNGVRSTATVSGPNTVGEASDGRAGPKTEPATTGTLGDATAGARDTVGSTPTEIPTTTTVAKTGSGGGPVEDVGTAPASTPPKIGSARRSDPADRPATALAPREFASTGKAVATHQIGSKLAPGSTADVEELLTRGQRKLQHGDIAAARQLFHRAFLMGDNRGAEGLATTFDPKVLATIPVVWFSPDPAKSEFWYTKAQELADSGTEEGSSSKD